MRSKFVSLQKAKFHELKRDFGASVSNPVLKATMFGRSPDSNNTMLVTVKYEDVIPAEFPSRQYMQTAFVSRIRDLLPMYERNMQLVGGSLLSADGSYKVIKFVFTATSIEGQSRGQGSVRAYDSIYTIMNPNVMIASLSFLHSGDNSEMEEILKRLQHRYNIHGYEEIELFYTDNCCHEYPMIVRAIPSLGRDDVGGAMEQQQDTSALPLMQLPETYDPRAITKYEDLVDFCTSLKTSVDSSENDVLLGFDVEWDSLTAQDKQRQKPETMQLATSDGKHIAVIDLSKVFAGITMTSDEKMVSSRNVLRTLFDHPKIRASGVGVKSDVTKFLKHYPEGLVGRRLHRQAFDARTIGQKHYVVEHGRHKARLQDLCASFLGRRLSKVRFEFIRPFVASCHWICAVCCSSTHT
jgi:hypothetical protein